ncbi:ABC-2 family transporter protein [Paenibacillus sp. FJAT-26967]|uniref:ABC transporter permease n=1 Tax=Paenibacillus sp. FJAT-26967 TaxID=1729690 RepID=UPI0008381B37|nr:ABC-2 family transporter protein [Paenibacillus sp. FJAT-26967]
MLAILSSGRAAYYLAVQSFKKTLVFRANYFIQLASEFIIVFLSVQLWEGIYNANGDLVKQSLSQMITYMALARLVAHIDMEFVRGVQERVISGAIGNELIRPMEHSWYLFAQESGRFVSRLLTLSLPIYTVVFFVLDINVPKDPLVLLLFFISLTLSFAIMFYINYFVAILAFWIQHLFTLNVLKNNLVRFLSGIYVPLWIFPVSVVVLVEYLPFAMVAFVPIQIYLQQYSIAKSVAFIGIQGFWLIVVYVWAKWMWSIMVKRIEISGG